MLKNIFYSIVIAVFIFITIGFFLPHEVHVERQIDIQRPAATVFTVLNSYRSFHAWSPWSQRDPEAVYELSGPERGPGARMSWAGDPRLVGTGWQEIIDSQANSLVRMHLEFEQQGSAESFFRIDETTEGVRLTWGFDTDLQEGQGWFGGLLARYFGLFFDSWIGSDYEAGLARLKALLESMPSADFSDLEVAVVEAEPQTILYAKSGSGDGSGDLSQSLAAAYQEIGAYMAVHGIEMTAQPMAITRVRNDNSYDVEAAIPVRLENPNGPEAEGADSVGRVRIGQSPGGPALRVIHLGPYESMAPSYEKLAAWAAAHGVSEGGVSWEQYVSDPGETPADALVTHIYFLLENDP